VGLRLFDIADEAAISHQDGVRRLLALALADKLTYLRKNPGLSKDALMAWSPLGLAVDLVNELVWKSLCDTAGEVNHILDTASFEKLLGRVRNEIGITCQQMARRLNELLPLYSRVYRRVKGDAQSHWPEAAYDMESQLEDLVYDGFLSDIESSRLLHYPRYLQGISERLESLAQNPARDRQRMDQVAPWWQPYLAALEEGSLYDENMDSYRWLLEEYRISLFAQRLGTDGKVSEKRLALAWDKWAQG